MIFFHRIKHKQTKKALIEYGYKMKIKNARALRVIIQQKIKKLCKHLRKKNQLDIYLTLFVDQSKKHLHQKWFIRIYRLFI